MKIPILYYEIVIKTDNKNSYNWIDINTYKI